MTIQDQKQPFTFEEVIDYTIKEAKEALDDPYKFKKPIKNVAVIGAGPSGVKYIKGFTRNENINFFFFYEYSCLQQDI
jgi:NADPH-dependent glutamate synthase beta subunit-like oxidoreductase